MKTLQKVTDMEARMLELLNAETISREDLNNLTAPEMERFRELSTERMNSLKDEEFDKFWDKISHLSSTETKNQYWELNHAKITAAIAKLMQDYNRMPAKREIATETGLSRKTIHLHLKNYSNHPLYIGQAEQFRFMADKVLAKVFKFAINGDIRAAKLYFDIIGMPKGCGSGNTSIQNNYIQINGHVISQEIVTKLSPHQLSEIENILKSAIAEPAKALM